MFARLVSRTKGDCLQRMFERKALFGISRPNAADFSFYALGDDNVWADETFNKTSTMYDG